MSGVDGERMAGDAGDGGREYSQLTEETQIPRDEIEVLGERITRPERAGTIQRDETRYAQQTHSPPDILDLREVHVIAVGRIGARHERGHSPRPPAS